MNKHSEFLSASDLAALRAESRWSGEPRFGDWRLALKSILAFWLVYYLTVVARAFLSQDPATILLNRSLTLVIGIALTIGIYAAFKLIVARTNLKRLITVACSARSWPTTAQAGLLIRR